VEQLVDYCDMTGVDILMVS